MQAYNFFVAFSAFCVLNASRLRRDKVLRWNISTTGEAVPAGSLFLNVCSDGAQCSVTLVGLLVTVVLLHPSGALLCRVFWDLACCTSADACIRRCLWQPFYSFLSSSFSPAACANLRPHAR